MIQASLFTVTPHYHLYHATSYLMTSPWGQVTKQIFGLAWIRRDHTFHTNVIWSLVKRIWWAQNEKFSVKQGQFVNVFPVLKIDWENHIAVAQDKGLYWKPLHTYTTCTNRIQSPLTPPPQPTHTPPPSHHHPTHHPHPTTTPHTTPIPPPPHTPPHTTTHHHHPPTKWMKILYASGPFY